MQRENEVPKRDKKQILARNQQIPYDECMSVKTNEQALSTGMKR